MLSKMARFCKPTINLSVITATLVHSQLIAVEQPILVTAFEIEWVKNRLTGNKELYFGRFYIQHRNSGDLIELQSSPRKLNETMWGTDCLLPNATRAFVTNIHGGSAPSA